MNRACFLVLAAILAGCGARADLGDDGFTGGASGSGGSGGAGGAGSTGHGIAVASAATGSDGTSVGEGATTSSSGPGATVGSGPTTSSAGSGPGTSSVGSGPGTSSAASGGQICPSLGGKCADCLSTACPATYCTCYNNPECIALINCDNGCNGSPDCQQACLTAHASGISDLYLLTDCAGSLCAPQCPGNQPLDPCNKCIFEDCAPAMNACLAEPECLVLYNCLEACGNVDLACQQGCYQQHGGGVATLQAVLMCLDGPCKPACN